MKAKKSKQLLVGTIVMWDGDTHDLGMVCKVSSAGVFVIWLSGQRGWIDHKDMAKVEIR